MFKGLFKFLAPVIGHLATGIFIALFFRPTWQSLDLQIGTDGVKVVTKDRRIIELSFQEKEIEDIIMWQVMFCGECSFSHIQVFYENRMDFPFQTIDLQHGSLIYSVRIGIPKKVDFQKRNTLKFLSRVL